MNVGWLCQRLIITVDYYFICLHPFQNVVVNFQQMHKIIAKTPLAIEAQSEIISFSTPLPSLRTSKAIRLWVMIIYSKKKTNDDDADVMALLKNIFNKTRKK